MRAMNGASFEYPTVKTGTSQDLLTIVTKAYERHLAANPAALPVKTPAQRLLLELPFVVVGKGVAALLSLLPAEAALRFHDVLFRTLAGRSYAFDEGSVNLGRARALVERLRRETGREPALVALISHPPVMGDLSHLNFELVRHAQLALRAARGRPCRPRIVAAIDPFALDTAPIYQEGLYAGFMGTYHLGLDRMAVTRGLSRGLLRGASWARMAHRLLRRLGGGGEVGMVLAGGVPSTTRTLYAAREWTAEVRRRSPLRGKPAEALSALRRLPGFEAFERAGPHGERLRGSAWRLAEAYVMSGVAGVYLEGDGGKSCAESGCLVPAGRRLAEAFLRALEVPEAEAPGLLAQLGEELTRETPFRRRFFRVLAARVARSRPVVLLPICHVIDGEKLGIELRDPCALASFAAGRARVMLGGGDGAVWEASPERFAEQFGRENFK